MRRWICVIALLRGFSGTGYAWTARPRLPVAIERQLEPATGDGAIPTGAWWLLA
jgi:hypothetical protein